jgi:exonuclease III
MLFIASVNSNGLRNNNKRSLVFNWLKQKKYDVVLLQETHCNNDVESKNWANEWGGTCFWNNANSSSKGVGIMIKDKLSLNIKNTKSLDEKGRLLSVDIQLSDNQTYTLASVYAPNNLRERKQFIKNLQTHFSQITNPIILGGDFNCTQNPKADRQSKASTYADEGSRELNDLISTLDLEDAWRRRNPHGKSYTFSRNYSKSRIDLFLLSKSIDNEIEHSKITHFPYSDHDLISIKLNYENTIRGPGQWKLNCSILNNAHYNELIERFWGMWEKKINNFNTTKQWWDMFKHHVKLLSIEFCSNLNKSEKNIKRLETELESLKQNDSSSTERIENISHQINNFYANQAHAAKIRSKSKYIQENEKSTAFFLNLEKRNGKQKLWSKIKTESGEVKVGIENILKEQTRYYKKLYTSENIDLHSAAYLLSNIENKLSNENMSILETNITPSELEKAIFEFKISKSPGEDGIPAEWYQHFWYLVKHKFHDLVNEILDSNTLSQSQYKGLISLIYKNGERENLKNWRPITLLNVDYKILTKCLSNRLKPYLPKIIHPDQKGYVDGRNINEANRFIQDIIEFADNEDKEGIIIFLDQTKAFDRCEWTWIDMCLHHFGFGPKFRGWVNMILKYSQIAIQTNGFISEYFHITRSIKQGCPIAPLLYIIQAEPLACTIRANKNVKGIELPIPLEKPLEAKINQYVDDTQLFAKNETVLHYIFNDLNNYEKASGALLNKEKTKALFIGKLRNQNPNFKEISWTNSFVKTLGVCHGYNISNEDIWRAKINKIKSCLQVWKSRDLTIQGKILVIKTFVYSNISYEIETRGIPEIYANEIENIINNFIWNNKRALISRKTLTREKALGGFNLYTIKDLKLALNVKMIYKVIHSNYYEWNAIGKHHLKKIDKIYKQSYFLCQCSDIEEIFKTLTLPTFYKNALKDWATFLKSFYPTSINEIIAENLFGNHNITFQNKAILVKSFAESNMNSIGDIWDLKNKAFKSEREIFQSLQNKRNWISEWSKIKHCIPKQFINSLKEGTINSNYKPILRRNQLAIISNKGKPLMPRELKTKVILQQIYVKEVIQPLKTEEKWEQKFSLPRNVLHWKIIWSNIFLSYASIQAQQFQWKFLHNVIFTEHKLNLMKASNGVCNICKTDRETLIHLFWECTDTKLIWAKINAVLNKIVQSPNTISLTYDIVSFGSTNNKFSNLINTLIFESKWYIWKYRNNRKFDVKKQTYDQCYQKIIYRVRETAQYQTFKMQETELRGTFLKIDKYLHE